MSTVAFTDNIPGVAVKTGYLAGIITGGSTDARLSITNTGDVPSNVYYRTPGQTIWTLLTLSPLSSEEFWFVLSTDNLRTIEYKFDAGSLQLSVIDFKTYGSSTAPITVITDNTPGGSAESPKMGDVSSGISLGTTIGTFRIINTGDNPLTFNVRKTGTTSYDQFQLTPLTSTERRIALTSSRTIEYYFDVSSILIQVVDRVATTTIPLTDVVSRIIALGFSVNDTSTGNISEAQIQMVLDDISAEVELASENYELISMRTISNETILSAAKHLVLRNGTIAQVLSWLRNKGATRGLTSDMIIISNETENKLQLKYDGAIDNMNKGFKIGA